MYLEIYTNFFKKIWFPNILEIAFNNSIIFREITLHNFIMFVPELGERPETCNKS